MPWLPAIAEWLHIIAGIAWLGTVLSTVLVAQPVAERLPPLERRRTMVAHSLAEKRIIRPAIAAVIVLGILRGTVWGPVRSLDVLVTPYGLTWLFSLLFTLGLFAWGRYAITPSLIALGRLDDGELADGGGRPSAALLGAIGRIRRTRRIQLVGFGVILACMVLMGFGF